MNIVANLDFPKLEKIVFIILFTDVSIFSLKTTLGFLFTKSLHNGLDNFGITIAFTVSNKICFGLYSIVSIPFVH